AKANVLISHALTKKLTMPFPDPTPLEEVIRYIKKNTVSEALPSGIPIWVDPDGLDRAGERLSSKIRFTSAEAPLRETLPKVLEQLNLRYVIEDGLLKIKDLGEGQN
ncbi:MAG TPA: hypothetical protein VFT74_16650, partial [Isosphaeraceae bacterium]|nr:hypothetical protein [Isosphaeraceae bacterium]